jgi:triosephosphate isomerase
MRKKIIAGNWKLNKNRAEAAALAKSIVAMYRPEAGVEVVLCPVFTALESVRQAIDKSVVRLGAQDCYWEEQGAFTGEVSCSLLKDAGCDYVIIGHSERRQFFGENDLAINKKVQAALKQNITPIVCVGETLQEREADRVEEVVGTQLRVGLQSLSAEQLEKVVIAYEPVWAIGTGKTATPEQAQAVHAFIRKILTELSVPAAAEKIRIQYGGSVNPGNVKALMSQPDIDGALVGGASLKAESFIDLLHFQESARV